MHTWVVLVFYLVCGALLCYFVIAPLIVRIALYYKDHVHYDFCIKGNLRMLTAIRKLNEPSRQADLYRDPQVDDLLTAGELEEALELVRERQRLAYERGLDERVAFYENYEQQILKLLAGRDSQG